MSVSPFQRLEERPGAMPAPSAGEPAQREEFGAGPGAEPGGLTPLESVCDLACFGLVAGLDPVRDKAAPQFSCARAPTQARHVRFIDATSERSADLPNYGLSATARAVAARLCLPLVSTPLLALIALADRLPDGPLLVALPRSQPQAFLDRLKPNTRAIVADRISVLRERRRIALGLPVRCCEVRLDLEIDHAFVFPMARHYLGRCAGPIAQRVHFHRADDADAASAHLITLGKFESNDPLGQNVFALVMRRLFYHRPSAQAGSWFDVNPFMLGRKVARHGGNTPRGAGEAMLAALQMDFLEPAPAATPQGRS